MAKISRLKKVTFALPEPLLEKLRALTYENRIPSTNAAVREALEQYIINLEREDFRRAMEAAARDPEFIKDLKDTEVAFRNVDKESAEMIPEW